MTMEHANTIAEPASMAALLTQAAELLSAPLEFPGGDGDDDGEAADSREVPHG